MPSSSAWAGGADGGTWIDCWRASDVLRAKDGAAHAELDARFDCSLYDERGAIQRKGRFRMLDVDDAGALHPAADARRIIRFDAYDGCRVLLSDKRVLTLEQYTSCSDVLCTNHC